MEGIRFRRRKEWSEKKTKKTSASPLAAARFFADVPLPDKSEAKFMIVWWGETWSPISITKATRQRILMKLRVVWRDANKEQGGDKQS